MTFHGYRQRIILGVSQICWPACQNGGGSGEDAETEPCFINMIINIYTNTSKC